MNWLNLELTILRSEEYLGSDPVQRATWLNLLAYCADQENGGVIKCCREWGGRRWLQLLGVTSDEVLADSMLWKWKGDDLQVWNYPKAKEVEVRRKRETGKKGGRPKKVNDTSTEKPDGSENEKPDGSILQKRKGKEGKGKEGNKYSEEFERFWKLYPKRVGKGDAFKAYEKSRKRVDFQTISEAIESQKKSDQWNRDGGQYIPNPATWLNQDRWEDELELDNAIKKPSGEVDSIEDLKKLGYSFD